MLSEIKIDKFRQLNNLHIEDLCRINLFIGANNTGKTSILDFICSEYKLTYISDIILENSIVSKIVSENNSVFFRIMSLIVPDLHCIFIKDDIIYFELENKSEFIKIHDFNQTTQYLFKLICLTLCSNNNILLLDDIFNNIHSSILEDLWYEFSLLFNLLNIQLFASSNCSDVWKSLVFATQEISISARVFRISSPLKVTKFTENEILLALERDLNID